MRSTLDGGNTVGKRVQPLVVARVPLQRHLGFTDVLTIEHLEGRHLGKQRLLRGVEMLHEVHQTLVELEHLGFRCSLTLVIGPVIGEPDLQSSIEEGHHPEAFQQCFGPEVRGLEDGVVGPERHGGASSTTGCFPRDM